MYFNSLFIYIFISFFIAKLSSHFQFTLHFHYLHSSNVSSTKLKAICFSILFEHLEWSKQERKWKFASWRLKNILNFFYTAKKFLLKNWKLLKNQNTYLVHESSLSFLMWNSLPSSFFFQPCTHTKKSALCDKNLLLTLQIEDEMCHKKLFFSFSFLSMFGNEIPLTYLFIHWTFHSLTEKKYLVIKIKEKSIKKGENEKLFFINKKWNEIK